MISDSPGREPVGKRKRESHGKNERIPHDEERKSSKQWMITCEKEEKVQQEKELG